MKLIISGLIILFLVTLMVNCAPTKEYLSLIEQADRLLEKSEQSQIRYFIQPTDSAILIEVNSAELSDTLNFDMLYKLLETDNHILALVKIPQIESGDFSAFSIHYFDAHGRTIGYRKKITLFNTQCQYDPIVQEELKFFDHSGVLVHAETQLSSSDGIEISAESGCQVNSEFPDTIYMAFHQTYFYLESGFN
jgi:hypothetical protein